MAVRKREWTSPSKKEKSSWVVDYRDMAGKRRLKTFATKKEADAFELTAKNEVRDGIHVASGETVTVLQAGELWLKKARRDGLEQSTVEDYERLLRLHIAPLIGGLKLTSLNSPRLREFEEKLLDEERPGKAKRTASMARRIISALGSLLGDAQERGLVVRNAVRESKVKRGSRESRLEKRAKGKLKIGVDIPTREEISVLAGALDGRWRPMILTAIFTGMRASELRGLRWQDVDLDSGKIRVHQRADRYNDIGNPKSETSERELPAPPIVINVLREWKLKCPLADTGKRDATGQKIKALDLCFPNGAGKVEGLRNILRRGLHPAWVKAGITTNDGKVDSEGNLIPKYTGLHCLRHWYASFCINRKEDGGLGLPPKMVQNRLGHSTIALTMDTYSHLFPSDDDGSEMAAASDFILSPVRA